MRKLSPRARRTLRIAAVATALLIAAALALGYYVFYYKSPEYQRLARDTDEAQRALDALGGDDAGATW